MMLIDYNIDRAIDDVTEHATQKKTGLSTGQEVFKTTAVESGRARRLSKPHGSSLEVFTLTWPETRKTIRPGKKIL